MTDQIERLPERDGVPDATNPKTLDDHALDHAVGGKTGATGGAKFQQSMENAGSGPTLTATGRGPGIASAGSA